MRHEKIFRREDGSQVKLQVFFRSEYYTASPWSFEVFLKKKRGKTWYSPIDEDDYRWRRLPLIARQQDKHRQYLEFVTKEEVLEAMNELWEESLRPSFDNLFPRLLTV
jgi:hypothetical protein